MVLFVLGVTTVLTMTFLGLEARTDLPQVFCILNYLLTMYLMRLAKIIFFIFKYFTGEVPNGIGLLCILRIHVYLFNSRSGLSLLLINTLHYSI